jgi:predicted nucleotidyltransferase/uncharacterized protein with HEPN domain
MIRHELRLEQIEEAVAALQRHLPVDASALDRDDVLRGSLIWRLSRLGFAASKANASLRAASPQVPWDELVALQEVASIDARPSSQQIWAATTDLVPRVAERLPQLRATAQRLDEAAASLQAREARAAGERGSVGDITLADLRARRDEIARIARKHGAISLRVFGSVARGEATPSSDVDFLVDLEPGRSLLDLAGLQVDLQDLLGRPVDVSHPSPGKFRDRIAREAVNL